MTELDPLAINGIHHLEFYVANAKQAVQFYVNAFGFEPIAYRGPETGFRESVSYVLKQGQIYFVLTSALKPISQIAAAVHLHSDHVSDIALSVPDCRSFYAEALRRGAISVSAPHGSEDSCGSILSATIKTYGDTRHSLVESSGYKGLFWPGFVAYDSFGQEGQDSLGQSSAKGVGLICIDHIVGNVELGKMNHWVQYYEHVLGFSQLQHFSDKDISTEYSALMSKVMKDGSGKIKFPINEPAQGKRKSQIEEYLEFNYGPGVQHVALETNDIIHTVKEMRRRGVAFLKVPKTYYDEVPKRVGSIKEDLKTISELGILVDRDEDGYLLQLFTKPVQDRPTLFFELIQREGSKGFGKGNFKALFEAIERDQAQRGNL